MKKKKSNRDKEYKSLNKWKIEMKQILLNKYKLNMFLE